MSYDISKDLKKRVSFEELVESKKCDCEKDIKVDDSIEEVIRKESGKETVLGFLECVASIIDKVYDFKVEFRPNTKNFVFDDNRTCEDASVIITYDINSRKPYKELNQRLSDEIEVDENNSNISSIQIYKKKMEAEIQFNFFFQDYMIGEKCISIFEESMIQYKKEISKYCSYIFMLEEIRDKYYDIYRQTTLVKNIVYRVIFVDKTINRQYGKITGVEVNNKQKG